MPDSVLRIEAPTLKNRVRLGCLCGFVYMCFHSHIAELSFLQHGPRCVVDHLREVVAREDRTQNGRTTWLPWL